MDLTVCCGTFGESAWTHLARTRAWPSVVREGLRWSHIHGTDLASSRNEAIERATSEWICVLDADDELAPGFYDAMSPHAEADGLLNPAASYVRDGIARQPMFWPEQHIQDGNYLIVSTLFRRDAFLELGGFRDVALYEDWDLWIRMMQAGAGVTQVPEAIVRVHVNPSSPHRMGCTPHQHRAAHEQVRRLNFPELYTDGVEASVGGSLAACPSPTQEAA